MFPAAGGRLRDFLAEAYRQAFKERQILLRSDSGTRCLHLTRRLQTGAAVVACGLALWGFVASTAYLWQAGWSASLSTALARSETLRSALAETKTRHDEEIALLRERLSQQTDRHASAQSQVAFLKSSLIDVTRRAGLLDHTRTRLSTQLAALQRELGASRENQRKLVEHVSQRLSHGIELISGAVTTIGLDLDSLLPAAGQGGPLVTGAASLGLLPEAHRLDPQIERWQSLQALVGELPLSAPLGRFRLSSRFGKRRDPITGRRARHSGVDLVARSGSPITAPGHARVVRAGWHGAYGRMVELDHGHGIRTRFGHLRAISVKRGQKVRLGERIGRLGNSGRSTGPHLHYEIRVRGRPTDPLKFLKASKAVAASLDTLVK